MRSTLPNRARMPRAAGLLLIQAILLLAPYSGLQAMAAPQTYAERPPISYFALTDGLHTRMRLGARLSTNDFSAVQWIADEEAAALRQLLEASAPIVSDTRLSLEEKRLAVRRMGYNARVDAILQRSEHFLQLALAEAAYYRLVTWMGHAWIEEVKSHGMTRDGMARHGRGAAPSGEPAAPGATTALAFTHGFGFLGEAIGRFHHISSARVPPAAPRSYEIYATRYDSKGRYTAALPDQCLKLTNGGLHTCDDKGYVVGQTYSIIMRYKKSVGVDIAEAGPWNIDDNFWATPADPTPRRMFADLALGMPEAQAAFYNGYNGGVDQYGRKVTAPFAIDLAFKVADDLGIPPKMNVWITVSMMWTDGWGGGGAGAAGQPGAGEAAVVEPVKTAAAGEDGSIIHEVKAGQTLWAIAVSYGTTLNRLRELNGLGADAIIIPGQKLTIHPAGAAATTAATTAATAAAIALGSTAVATAPAGEATSDPAANRTPVSAPARTAQAALAASGAVKTAVPPAGSVTTATALALLSPVDRPAAPGGRLDLEFDPLLVAIAAAAALGLGLIAWGGWLRRRQ